MAFGQNLETQTINTRLFRKVNASNLFKANNEYCFSTANSTKLIAHGEFAIVLKEEEYTGAYDSQDADAGKNFGYDEFRVVLTKEELISKIECIVVPDSWNDEIDAELYDTDKDPMVWIENLREYSVVVFVSETDYNVDFNF